MTTQAQIVAKSPTDRGKTQDQEDTTAHVSPRSKELVIGIVGYAGAGCSTVAKKLRDFLHESGYEVHYIKLSKLIEARADPGQVPAVEDGVDEGKQKLERACRLQDIGDALRKKHGNYAIASLSTKSIIETRGQVERGQSKLAFILDCIKHNEEVTLLRRVYDQSFRLIAVHCQRTERESRLIGDYRSMAKYKGAEKEKVLEYMNRDEEDKKRLFGQHVRDAFYLADYFLDNNRKTTDAVRLNSDIERFIDLLLGRNLIRPDLHEVGMYHAHTAALKSACLSRQVGAALEVHGKIVATGTNEVPKFGGGVYGSGERPDNRCFAWDWKSDGVTFKGCHNTRRKRLLRENIVAWLADNFSAQLGHGLIMAHPNSY
jgi:deoxycytidylate deaminase/nucleoside-triphosphatase THEP1